MTDSVPRSDYTQELLDEFLLTETPDIYGFKGQGVVLLTTDKNINQYGLVVEAERQKQKSEAEAETAPLMEKFSACSLGKIKKIELALNWTNALVCNRDGDEDSLARGQLPLAETIVLAEKPEYLKLFLPAIAYDSLKEKAKTSLTTLTDPNFVSSLTFKLSYENMPVLLKRDGLYLTAGEISSVIEEMSAQIEEPAVIEIEEEPENGGELTEQEPEAATLPQGPSADAPSEGTTHGE